MPAADELLMRRIHEHQNVIGDLGALDNQWLEQC